MNASNFGYKIDVLNNRTMILSQYFIYMYYSIRKKRFRPYFFNENLVDFNEAHLHEANVNIHEEYMNFFHLSRASVDGKQHLREVVEQRTWFRLADEKPDSCGSPGSYSLDIRIYRQTKV
jgi:hypothetical protein